MNDFINGLQYADGQFQDEIGLTADGINFGDKDSMGEDGYDSILGLGNKKKRQARQAARKLKRAEKKIARGKGDSKRVAKLLEKARKKGGDPNKIKQLEQQIASGEELDEQELLEGVSDVIDEDEFDEEMGNDFGDEEDDDEGDSGSSRAGSAKDKSVKSKLPIIIGISLGVVALGATIILFVRKRK